MKRGRTLAGDPIFSDTVYTVNMKVRIMENRKVAGAGDQRRPEGVWLAGLTVDVVGDQSCSQATNDHIKYDSNGNCGVSPVSSERSVARYSAHLACMRPLEEGVWSVRAK